MRNKTGLLYALRVKAERQMLRATRNPSVCVCGCSGASFPCLRAGREMDFSESIVSGDLF